MEKKDRTIEWLMQECKCTAPCAILAIGYAKGNVFVARDMLSNRTFAAKCEREFLEVSR